MTKKTMTRLVLLGALLAAPPGATLAEDHVVEYYHLDAVGNVRAVTDEAGQVIERHDYLPFGEEWCPGPPAGVCGSVPPGQPKRFTGKERDPETGLDYFGARYYGARIGRFTAIDPYLDQSSAILNAQLWNRYAYGRNNPLRYVDPDGRDGWDIATGAANAFGSNFSLGLGRQSASNTDFAFGQFLGDVASIPAGYAWGNAGATLTGAGLVGAPESGGATLVVTAAGVAIMVQGGTAALSGLANAGISLSKKRGGDWTAGTKKEIDAANADRHGGSYGCDNCGKTLEKVGNKKGVPTPDNQLQRHHKEPLRQGQPPGKRGPSITENSEVLCPGCHKEVHQ
jgi:RHS repeat-associated protein